MSKITNDGLIRPATGCFIAVPIWQQRQRVDWTFKRGANTVFRFQTVVWTGCKLYIN